MTLIEYQIDYSDLSKDEQHSLIEKLESISYLGFFVCPDLHSGKFYLTSEKDLSLINFPKGCRLTRLQSYQGNQYLHLSLQYHIE